MNKWKTDAGSVTQWMLPMFAYNLFFNSLFYFLAHIYNCRAVQGLLVSSHLTILFFLTMSPMDDVLLLPTSSRILSPPWVPFPLSLASPLYCMVPPPPIYKLSWFVNNLKTLNGLWLDTVGTHAPIQLLALQVVQKYRFVLLTKLCTYRVLIHYSLFYRNGKGKDPIWNLFCNVFLSYIP